MRVVYLYVQLYVLKDNFVGRNFDCDIVKLEIIKVVWKLINYILISNKCVVFILIILDMYSCEYIIKSLFSLYCVKFMDFIMYFNI